MDSNHGKAKIYDNEIFCEEYSCYREEKKMKCPFCTNEMIVGSIAQDRYAIKWVPIDQNRGILNFTPLVKGIKLT